MVSEQTKRPPARTFTEGERAVIFVAFERLGSICLVGGAGLRPKPRGRPPTNHGVSAPKTEIEMLRIENERLRAEVAYVGKLRALRSQKRH